MTYVGALTWTHDKSFQRKGFFIHPAGITQVYVFEAESRCAAFLVNHEFGRKAIVLFRNSSFTLPRKSISILPDCKTVAFNTAEASLFELLFVLIFIILKKQECRMFFS